MLQENLARIRQQITRACNSAARPIDTVQLLAVSKKQPDSLIEQAYALGLRHFGENYVQDLARRKERLSHLSEAKWHLIGPLQTNKVKQALSLADYFHALDSVRLANELSKRHGQIYGQKATCWPVFLEVNIDLDPQKHGFSPQELPEALEQIRKLPGINVMGLMCVPRHADSPESARKSFRALKNLAQRAGLSELSMGMSHDFTVAIEEGATWIRLGTLLFGARGEK